MPLLLFGLLARLLPYPERGIVDVGRAIEHVCCDFLIFFGSVCKF
jgi:hypothetical protein